MATFSSKLTDEIYEVMVFLNKISTPFRNTLDDFKRAFQERYEEAEMPLNQVLDKELGLGYPIGNSGDINYLIDDLILPANPENSMTYNDPFQTILLKKYLEAYAGHKRVIELADDCLSNNQPYWDDLPDTLSAMGSIIRADEGKEQLYIKLIGGASSAACLLGRFCHLDDEIFALTKQIIGKEEQLRTDVIYAEIVHLPRARVGNILSHPVLRSYEIHYLANSGVELEKQIPISDLTLSLKSGELILKSIKYNKQVIPRLTNAHNFRNNSMPVYHFLCDLQTQNQRSGFFFQWKGLLSQLDYWPRVIYKNHILSREKWRIKGINSKELDKLTDSALIEQFAKIRSDRNIPQFVILPEGDNELFVDLGNALSLRMLYPILKKKEEFIIEEFLFNPVNAVVKSQQGRFTNEFIIPFYRNK